MVLVCVLILFFAMGTRLRIDFSHNSVSPVKASASSLIANLDAKVLYKETAPLASEQAKKSTVLDDTDVVFVGEPGSFSITVTVHYIEVEITSPLSGAILSGVVKLITAVTDNTAVTKVDFYADDYLISTDTTSPYSVSWNTADVPDGIYSLVAVVWDSIKSTSCDPVSVMVDNIGNGVIIIQPESGDVVKGIVDTIAEASADTIRVVFFDNTTSFATDDTGSGFFSASWDTTALTDGVYSLFAVAYDHSGTPVTSATVSVTVDNTPPQVNITSPSPGEIISSPTVEITASATDSSGIAKVEFYVDGNFLTYGTSNPYSVSWNTQGASDGIHTIAAKAFDKAGNAASHSIDIRLDTTSPSVSLTETPEKTVKGNRGKVEVRFAWQGKDDVTPEDKLEYQYKLEGYQEDWSSWSTGKEITFLLAVGEYTFKVRAKDGAGNFPPEEDTKTAKYSFKVILPVVIYPNPAYPDRGDVVKIANLPLGSVVYIYSIVGELIRTLDGPGEVSIEGGSNTAIWDCRNEYGERVARGIYIYYCLQVTGDRKTGKIAIIR